MHEPYHTDIFLFLQKKETENLNEMLPIYGIISINNLYLIALLLCINSQKLHIKSVIPVLRLKLTFRREVFGVIQAAIDLSNH